MDSSPHINRDADLLRVFIDSAMAGRAMGYRRDDLQLSLRRLVEQLEVERSKVEVLQHIVDGYPNLKEQLETARRYEDEEQRLAAQMREERDEALALVQRVEEQNEFHKGEVALLSEMIDGLKEQLETARTELAEAAQSPASEPDDRTMEEILRDAGAHYQDSDPATKFHAFCKDGSLQPCEICVGSCGIEEAEEAAQSPAKKPETN